MSVANKDIAANQKAGIGLKQIGAILSFRVVDKYGEAYKAYNRKVIKASNL